MHCRHALSEKLTLSLNKMEYPKYSVSLEKHPNYPIIWNSLFDKRRVISTQLLIKLFKNDVPVTFLFAYFSIKGDLMTTVSASIFVLTMTASSLFAGNCAKHNKANLEAMSCEAGFTWSETKAECVQETA